MPRDPVCGMEVEQTTASTTFDGRAFYFCSLGCRDAFQLAPTEYATLAGLLPPALGSLLELARNLWWSWHPDARALFQTLDPQGRGPVDNPLGLLLKLDRETLASRAADPAVLRLYAHVMAAFEADLGAHRRAGTGPRWSAGSIAYFSAEFGVHSTLPVYSGGLGVLAGDITKEASDLGVPLVGVGFMYPQGYFRQRLTPEGRQEEVYERFNRALAPTEPACTISGRPCVVELPLPDTMLQAAVWVVRVGRVPLYLIDTGVEGNRPADREISARLYSGDQEFRLRQEIVLGIGGVRVLRALGIAPVVWHANEGHSAFMMLERLREIVEAGSSFLAARERVQASTVFTTHTPVPAGHDTFPFPLVEKYFASYWLALGLNREQFLALGAHDDGFGPRFNMTALALRLSGHRAAVSRRHAEVSRRMWRSLWAGADEDRVPIVAVTNGVHVPSWVASQLDRLYRVYFGEDWIDRHDDPDVWKRAEAIPDDELWQTHVTLKTQLMKFLRDRARQCWAEEGTTAQTIAAGALLEPEVLTLGFARRFATYKRASLIFRNPKRLASLLTHTRRPIQLIFAGKAHPADEPAKEVLQTIYRAALDPVYMGRIAFVEGYDMEVARYLVQGVDVWLNTPRPPLEASGTSGEKAAVNGVPNLSVLDGWWAEAFDGSNGWAIQAGTADLGAEAQDTADAEVLYGLLESVVGPLYYERDSRGIPRRWVRLMKRVIETIPPRFSARRLLKEYVERLYVPALRG